MKKSKLIFLVAFLLVFLSFFSTSILNKKTANASELIIEISSVTDLEKIGNDAGYPLNANYQLTADLDFSAVDSFLPIGQGANAIEVNHFTGVFDGKGYKIKNLKFSAVTPIYHFGLFASLKNATVKNLAIENLVIANDIFSLNLSNTISLYVGGISAKAEASTIINSQVGFAPASNLASSSGILHFGGISASAISGTVIKNIKTNVNANFTISSSLSNSFAFGGIVGLLEGSSITNAISTSNLKVSTVKEQILEDILFMNIGSVVGYVAGESAKVVSTYSDFALINDYNKSNQQNVGGVIGTVSSSQIPFSQNLSYNHFYSRSKTTAAQNYVSMTNAFGQKGYYDDSTSKYHVLAQNNFGVFSNEDLNNANMWSTYESEKWNKETVWTFSLVSVPTLQVFSSYEVSLKLQDTRISLSEGVSPSEILTLEFASGSETTQTFKYGETAQVLIAIINDFDVYYELASVELDGTSVKNNSNFTITTLSEEQAAIHDTKRAYLVEFQVSDSLKGGLSVTLSKVNFNFTIETENEDMGTIRRRNSTITTAKIEMEISAANRYEFVAVARNNEMAFKKWVMYVPKTDVIVNDEIEYDIFELGTYANYAQITFTFGPRGTQDITQHILNNGKLVAIFTNNVVKTTIKTEVSGKGADNKSGFITYEQGGEKIDISNPITFEKGKTITLVANAAQGYKFIGWFDSSNKKVSASATIEYTLPNDELIEETTIKAVFEETASSGNSLTLWIALGSVLGGGLVVVLIIVAVRKRRDNSYRSFY